MKILVIPANDYLHNPTIARQQYIYEELAKTHEVHVMHFHINKGMDLSTNTIIHNATMFPFTNQALHYVFNAPYHYYAIKRVIIKHKIDIIFTSNVLASSAAISVAKSRNIPVIFDLNNWLPESAIMHIKNVHIQNLIRNTVERITNNNLKESDLTIVPSTSLKNKLVKMEVPTQLITNGVDTNLFTYRSDRSARHLLGLSENEFCIGFIGDLGKWGCLADHIRNLPELLAYNPDIKIVVLGELTDPLYKTKIITLCHDLGVFKNIIFTGEIPYPELPEFISSMDACTVLASPEEIIDHTVPVSYYECCACNIPTLMESMQVNLNIKGTNVSLYNDTNEYISQIKYLAETHHNPHIDVSEHSWSNKAKQYEKFALALIQ